MNRMTWPFMHTMFKLVGYFWHTFSPCECSIKDQENVENINDKKKNKKYDHKFSQTFRTLKSNFSKSPLVSLLIASESSLPYSKKMKLAYCLLMHEVITCSVLVWVLFCLVPKFMVCIYF